MHPERVGPYEVEELLAAGGMAEIYIGKKAGPGGFGKRVVIKRIAKKLLGDREIEAMFVDEARVQALLDHPNIVQIYDFGEDKGSYYMAMEFVSGATLRWVVDNSVAVRRPLPLHHAMRITSDILAGLHFAHERSDEDGTPLKLVHRDISPVNVLVSRTGVAKLCDFGVAKSQIQSVFTRAGIVKGKFRYMSPEQINADPLDRRSDVFSVGACLWEMLAGRRLFDAPAEDAVVTQIRSGNYPSPSDFRAGMPRAIDRILRRALQPRPEKRFKTARDFQLACEEILRLLPNPSNTVLVGEYVSAELDGTAAYTEGRRRDASEGDSLMSSGFDLLDPPVPTSPTKIASPLSDDDEESTEAAPPPSAAGKLMSAALVAPATVFAGVARAVGGVGSLFSTKKVAEPAVRIARTTTSRDE